MYTNREPVDVVSAIPLEGTYVLFEFSDGAQFPLNLRRFMRGPIFEAVLLSGTFADFVVDPDSGTIVWPNGADLDPEVLRYAGDDVAFGLDIASRTNTILNKTSASWGTRRSISRGSWRAVDERGLKAIRRAKRSKYVIKVDTDAPFRATPAPITFDAQLLTAGRVNAVAAHRLYSKRWLVPSQWR